MAKELKPLTGRQQVAFNAIRDGADTKGVAEALGIKPAGAHSHINALKAKGYINDNLEIIATPVTASATAPSATLTTTQAATNGTGPASEIFQLDAHVRTAVDAQMADLRSTIEQIDSAIQAHLNRVADIDSEREKLKVERDQHEESVKGLNARRDSLEDAVRALGESPAAAA